MREHKWLVSGTSELLYTEKNVYNDHPHLCVVVQSTAAVKILVPSFGVVMPQECRVASAFGGCPPIPPDVCGPGMMA